MTAKQEAAANLWLEKGSTFETASGDLYDYFRPDPAAIHLKDIAHALSFTVRFGGHIRQSYTVAQHSVLCSRIVEAWGQDWQASAGALFHDAHEAYIGDIPRPLKRWLEPAISEFAATADTAIAKSLDINPELFHHPAVKRADDLTVQIEANLLLTYGPGGHPERELPEGISLVDFLCETAAEAETMFLSRAKELGYAE